MHIINCIVPVQQLIKNQDLQSLVWKYSKIWKMWSELFIFACRKI